MSNRRSDEIALDLTADEWDVLASGLREWGGPATLTEPWARAMGFDGVEHFWRKVDRLEQAIDDHRPLAADDWLRVIQATELAFISDAVGSGIEWSITTGLTDEETVSLLRSIQRKWMSAAHSG